MESYEEQLSKAIADLIAQKKITGFYGAQAKELYVRYGYYIEKNEKIDWSKVVPLSQSSMASYGTLASPTYEYVQQCFGQIAVLKLNGGLGTSMGCDGPKSLIPVKGGDSFLDLSCKQIYYINRKYGVNVPLILMNSFYTESETRSHLNHAYDIEIVHFNQFELPRMDTETRMPAQVAESALFYPPGHGFVYECLKSTGTLEYLMARGIKYIFISNADNLGAVLDEKIAYYVITAQPDFLSEQTPKTLADVKGGVLMEYEGRTRLLETAQVPFEHIKDFCDLNVFKSFNVNNLWINCHSLKQLQRINLDLIVNPKVADGKNVIYLEVAAGAAISLFKKVEGLLVPRERFSPVKKCSDLLLIESDCYYLKENFYLVYQFVPPVVKLDVKLKQFQKMFKAIPSLKDCTKFEAEGEVECHDNVTIKGEMKIAVGEKKILESGATYVDGKKQ